MPTPLRSPGRVDAPVLADRAFVLLLAAVSVAFGWIVWQLAGAVLWGTIIAIVFALFSLTTLKLR